MKKIVCIFLALTLIFVSACSNDKDNESTLIEHNCEGLIISLPSDYIESPSDKYTFYYSNANSICIVNREGKASIKASGIVIENLEQYTATIIHSIDPTIVTNEYNNGYYFEWTKKINDTEYSYLGYTIDTGNAYFLVQFATLKSEYSDMRDTLLVYVNNIKIGA